MLYDDDGIKGAKFLLPPTSYDKKRNDSPMKERVPLFVYNNANESIVDKIHKKERRKSLII